MENNPNIILIVMDTVRADHLSCYGYHRETTPNIDEIAKRGVLFENAFSTAPWTPPSHASIFTGKYPSYHKTIGKNVFLGKDNNTLPEVLGKAFGKKSYETIGITGCNLLGSKNGFNRGFQTYIEMFRTLSYFRYSKPGIRGITNHITNGPDQHAYRTNEIIKGLLKSSRFKRNPFFLFINYFNCHTPYDPPLPYQKFYDDLLMKDSDLDFQKLDYITKKGGWLSYITKEINISEKEWEIVKACYDGEIAYLDHRIGRLVNFLENEGIFDNTLFIITSDHGESFGEHGLASHPHGLYDNLIHVPLIITYPQEIPERKRFSNIVSLIDIFPTTLDILGIDEYRSNIQGKSLHPFEDRKIHDFICAEYGGANRLEIFRRQFIKYGNKLKDIDKGLKCLRTQSYKYIFSWDKEEELYDIPNDPLEQTNIAERYPKKVAYFRRQLEKAIDISYFGPEGLLLTKERKEMLNRLKSLGYI